MSDSREIFTVNMICPYCKLSFRKKIEIKKKTGLSSILIKNHDGGPNCPSFVAFIDGNGKHRGSQKIDNIDEDSSMSDKILENSRKNINELDNILRFYHLKMPRKEGKGFDHKVANVMDRSFMSSKFYKNLISFLTIIDDRNIFGIIAYDRDINFEGGIIIYGKYLRMIYIFLWKDQKLIQNKSFDELQGNANLLVEKLIEIYDLTDFFF